MILLLFSSGSCAQLLVGETASLTGFTKESGYSDLSVKNWEKRDLESDPLTDSSTIERKKNGARWSWNEGPCNSLFSQNEWSCRGDDTFDSLKLWSLLTTDWILFHRNESKKRPWIRSASAGLLSFALFFSNCNLSWLYLTACRQHHLVSLDTVVLAVKFYIYFFCASEDELTSSQVCSHQAIDL